MRALLALLLLLAAPSLADAPRRVVSMNLCTDQLALLIGAPGQIVSVSDWAFRERASTMVAEARRTIRNGATAEEVFALQPDLVLASSFTSAAALDMLRRLGVRIEAFPVVSRPAEVAAQIRRMGELLGRRDRAEAEASAFEAAFAAQAARVAGLTPLPAAYHYPNGFTSGDGTLAHELLLAAGLSNAAADLGYGGNARLPLEALVLARPMLVETRHISDGVVGRAYETDAHPALAAVRAASGSALVEERWQVCGTPAVTEALRALVDARLRAGPDGPGVGRP
jgi:iron complex transport system substrate-binding protein